MLTSPVVSYAYAYASDRLSAGAAHGYALYQMAVVAKGGIGSVAIIIKIADQTTGGSSSVRL